MTFARPAVLWLLALVPLAAALVAWSGARQLRALARLGDAALVDRLLAPDARRARRWRDALWPAALGMAIFALARPQWGRAVQLVEQHGNQVVVVLDVSASMLAGDVKPSRLARAKAEIGRLFELLPDDEVGLVLFAGASFVQLPLTADHATARGFLDAAQPAVISRPGTEIAEALRTALGAFDMRREGGKAILLITDGEDHAADPLAAAAEAREAGVRIFAIGYGSPDGERVPELDDAGRVVGWKVDAQGQPVVSRLAEPALQGLADATGGGYWRAGAAGGAVDGVVAALGALERGSGEGRIETSRVERFQPFLLAAVALMLLAEAGPPRRRRAGAHAAAAAALLLAGCAPGAAADVRAGNDALAAGDLETAIARYTAAADAAPEAPEPAYNLGLAHTAGGDFAAARRALQRSLIGARGELAVAGWYNLGTAALAAGELDLAVDALTEALRLDAADPDAKHNLELALAMRQAAEAAEAAQDERQAEGQDGPTDEGGEPRPGERPGEGQESGQGDDAGREASAGPGTGTPGATGTPAPGDAAAQADAAAGTATAMAAAGGTPGAGREGARGTPGAGQAAGRGGAATAMSRDEARRLLEAVGGRARTLGEVLRMRLVAPGDVPAQDW